MSAICRKCKIRNKSTVMSENIEFLGLNVIKINIIFIQSFVSLRIYINIQNYICADEKKIENKMSTKNSWVMDKE